MALEVALRVALGVALGGSLNAMRFPSPVTWLQERLEPDYSSRSRATELGNPKVFKMLPSAIPTMYFEVVQSTPSKSA